MAEYFTKLKEKQVKEFNGANCYPVVKEGEISLKGVTAGVNHVFTTEYPPVGIHDNNEGFYVMSGSGKALVGEHEVEIDKGSCFFAPAGVPHALKKNPESDNMEVFLFHFPAQCGECK